MEVSGVVLGYLAIVPYPVLDWDAEVKGPGLPGLGLAVAPPNKAGTVGSGCVPVEDAGGKGLFPGYHMLVPRIANALS